jgi:phosphatidylcholine synthase
MSEPGPVDRPLRDGRRMAAFSVHVLTACGAGLALLALIAAVQGQWVAMFVWLTLALIVDGVDGTFARALKVKETLPNWSGDALDFVVDVTTYVFVPAYAITASGLLPALVATPLGIAIVVSGALYFADLRMKTADNYFRGFPVLWNVTAFYLFLLQPHPWMAAVLVAIFVGLTFAPIRFPHPIRVTQRRALNIALLALWSVLGTVALAFNLEPAPWITAVLCAIALYFLAGGLFRHSD